MKIAPDKQELIELAYAKMYFGKYKNWYLSDIPEYYYVWFQQKGFAKNKSGAQMQAVFELKLNGLEHVLKEIRAHFPPPKKSGLK